MTKKLATCLRVSGSSLRSISTPFLRSASSTSSSIANILNMRFVSDGPHMVRSGSHMAACARDSQAVPRVMRVCRRLPSSE